MNKSKQGIITFGFAGVFAIPNELGTNANKFFDHGLSKEEKKSIGMRKKHDGTKEQIQKI
jgi:hypothetical protein